MRSIPTPTSRPQPPPPKTKQTPQPRMPVGPASCPLYRSRCSRPRTAISRHGKGDTPQVLALLSLILQMLCQREAEQSQCPFQHPEGPSIWLVEKKKTCLHQNQLHRGRRHRRLQSACEQTPKDLHRVSQYPASVRRVLTRNGMTGKRGRPGGRHSR
jgi:hypothetical protein